MIFMMVQIRYIIDVSWYYSRHSLAHLTMARSLNSSIRNGASLSATFDVGAVIVSHDITVVLGMLSTGIFERWMKTTVYLP